MRPLIPLALAALLAACLPFGGPDGAASRTQGTTASPLSAEAVRVTSLDAPAATPAASAGTAARPSATPSATPAATAPQPRPAAAEGASAPPAAAASAAAAGDPAAAPAGPVEETPPPAPKSAAELACEGQGGTWARAGGSVAMTCFRPTRDGGQSCRRESDCSTLCLARSRSCAPLTPLFGCHEVLQDDGSAVTLCLD